MTTLVTGATGFLGGRLVHHLRERGETVIALGRNSEKLAELAAIGAQVHRCDLTDRLHPTDIDKSDEINCVVHCAALSSPFGALTDFEAANVTATLRLCDFAKLLEIPRFIHISSPAIYYRPQDQFLIHEDMDLPNPVNHYARTKAQAEQIALREMGTNTIILRPRGIYGHGDTALMPRLMKAAASGTLPLLREGTARTDITHVDDVVAAILCSRSDASRAQQIFNISGGIGLCLKDVIETVGARLSIPIRWRKAPVPLAMGAARIMEGLAAVGGWKSEPRATPYSVGLLAYSQTLDISRAATILNWQPKVSFEQGLIEALGSAR